jgi:hypothetical protein
VAKPSVISTVDNDRMSQISATSFVVGFLALMCAMVVGFESTLKTAMPNSTDYGYPEPLEGPVSHLSVARQADAACYEARAVMLGKQIDASNDAMGETIANGAAFAPDVQAQTAGGHRE